MLASLWGEAVEQSTLMPLRRASTRIFASKKYDYLCKIKKMKARVWREANVPQ